VWRACNNESLDELKRLVDEEEAGTEYRGHVFD